MKTLPKKGRGKNSDKLVGEVAQVDLILFEWFYKKIPTKELQKLFNISEATISNIVKTYNFQADEELRSSRRSDKLRQRSNWKRGKDSKIHKDRTGEKFTTRQGYEVEITNYILSGECEYQFLHDKKHIFKSSYREISTGSVSYPYHKTVCDVGYLGVGKHEGSKDIGNKKYNTWHGLIQRSYSAKVHERKPHYKGCSVVEEWHNFQNFGDWYDENFNSDVMQNWELDKDILVKGNKVYSPETCAFVPIEINLLLTKNKARRGDYPIGVFLDNGKFRAVVNIDGVQKYFGSHATPEEAFKAHKEAKEKYIKEKADKWKNLIDPRVYEALYKYEVEITD